MRDAPTVSPWFRLAVPVEHLAERLAVLAKRSEAVHRKIHSPEHILRQKAPQFPERRQKNRIKRLSYCRDEQCYAFARPAHLADGLVGSGSRLRPHLLNSCALCVDIGQCAAYRSADENGDDSDPAHDKGKEPSECYTCGYVRFVVDKITARLR